MDDSPHPLSSSLRSGPDALPTPRPLSPVPDASRRETRPLSSSLEAPRSAPAATLFGHPALRLLIRMKIAGGLRSQIRRLKRPSGWLFAIFGLVLFGTWVGGIVVSTVARRSQTFDQDTVMLWTRVGLLVVCTMTVVSAFSHRGLYLPKEEIELAFSAPLRRSDVIRYRMGVSLLRSIVAGALFGLGAARRMPVAFYAFAGVMVTMLTVPILGQAIALLLGDAENRLGRLAKRLPLRPILGLFAAVVGLSMLALIFADDDDFGRAAWAVNPSQGMLTQDLAQSPLVHAILLPFEPWARMISAPDAGTFFGWFAFCALVWIAAWELTARIPVDFRETSLATSADVAKRLRRIRRGGSGVAGTLTSKSRLSWRVPWFFGRGRFGAVAWLKLATISRKARGAFVFAAAVLLFVTIMLSITWRGSSAESALGGAVALAAFGTIYLCSGLRFDFRNDLDQMEQIKAWPLGPSLVFLATVLPQVLVVSVLLAAGIALRCIVTGTFHPGILGVLFFQPLVGFAWTSVDNAVYLYAPVRYAPGQEGALQHIGRSVVMALLRFLLLGVAIVCAALPGAAIAFGAQKLLGVGEVASVVAGAAVAWVGLLGVDAALVYAGGKMLQRFDVARDKA